MYSPLEVRRAFGLLFIGVAISVGLASVLSEVIFEQKDPFNYYVIIWLCSFTITFGAIFGKWKNIIPAIRVRMKNSVKWSASVKTINGLSCDMLSVARGVSPFMYQ